MVVYRGLMENPNNRAMLGATDIRRQANASALGPIVEAGKQQEYLHLARLFYLLMIVLGKGCRSLASR